MSAKIIGETLYCPVTEIKLQRNNRKERYQVYEKDQTTSDNILPYSRVLTCTMGVLAPSPRDDLADT